MIDAAEDVDALRVGIGMIAETADEPEGHFRRAGAEEEISPSVVQKRVGDSFAAVGELSCGAEGIEVGILCGPATALRDEVRVLVRFVRPDGNGRVRLIGLQEILLTIPDEALRTFGILQFDPQIVAIIDRCVNRAGGENDLCRLILIIPCGGRSVAEGVEDEVLIAVLVEGVGGGAAAVERGLQLVGRIVGEGDFLAVVGQKPNLQLLSVEGKSVSEPIHDFPSQGLPVQLVRSFRRRFIARARLSISRAFSIARTPAADVAIPPSQDSRPNSPKTAD